MYKTFVLRAPVPGVVKMSSATLQTKQGPVTLPLDGLNALANAGLFAVLMLFLASAGGKTANVGVNLLKAERIYDALLELDLTQNLLLETLKKH